MLLVESLVQLRGLAERLHVEEQQSVHDGAEVAAYYDGRSAGYDQHNRSSQLVLAQRALELAGWLQPGTDRARLVLDIGSGTGLSSEAVRSLTAQHDCSRAGVVGCDVSLGMLAERGRERDEGACSRGRVCH
jgi:ubiquinone/menaquinone biosynthesis C-methylase UbiE